MREVDLDNLSVKDLVDHAVLAQAFKCYLTDVLMFEEDEDMIGVSIEYQHNHGYEDKYIYVVMRDGSQIALHTDGIGTVLKAESPIVLSEVDHILMPDGTKLPVP